MYGSLYNFLGFEITKLFQLRVIVEDEVYYDYLRYFHLKL